MAKKASKKKTQYEWAWVKTNDPGKPSVAEKEKVTTTFEPFIQKIKKSLPPLEEPQQYNQITDVFSKWRGSYFYVMTY